MMLKSFSFRQDFYPLNGVILSNDFTLERTRPDEEEIDLIAAKDMLIANSSTDLLMMMTLVLQDHIEKYDHWCGDSCCINVRNPVCELEPHYVKLERKGRVYLEDMIEMMYLKLEIEQKFFSIRKLKENKFLGFKSIT